MAYRNVCFFLKIWCMFCSLPTYFLLGLTEFCVKCTKLNLSSYHPHILTQQQEGGRFKQSRCYMERNEDQDSATVSRLQLNNSSVVPSVSFFAGLQCPSISFIKLYENHSNAGFLCRSNTSLSLGNVQWLSFGAAVEKVHFLVFGLFSPRNGFR